MDTNKDKMTELTKKLNSLEERIKPNDPMGNPTYKKAKALLDKLEKGDTFKYLLFFCP